MKTKFCLATTILIGLVTFASAQVKTEVPSIVSGAKPAKYTVK